MSAPEERMPPAVTVDLEGELRNYFLARVAQHTSDRYAGLPMSKFPEDLRVYEHLLWEQAPDTVVEIGTQSGASALWFRDHLELLRKYQRLVGDIRIITIDVVSNKLAGLPTSGIEIITGDVRSQQIQAQVRDLAGRNVMVVEDSAHTYETTTAALDGFADLIPPGGFFVVEDTCVDVDSLRLTEGWPRGVVPAVNDWLGRNPGFRVRRDLELYGVTCHPGGFLQRSE
jgi:cephalosporin hydroxylase